MAKSGQNELLAGLAPDDRTTLPASTVQKLLCLLPEVEKDQAVKLLGYPVKSVGRLMSTHYVAVEADQTVAEVLEQVRFHRHGADTLDMLYVTDASGKLVDEIRLGEFLLVDQQQPVSALMDNRFIALKYESDPGGGGEGVSAGRPGGPAVGER